MKKRILAAVLLLFPIVLPAQEGRVEVRYEAVETLTPEVQGLMEFLEVYYLKATVHGDIRGKKWVLWAHQVENGEVSSRPLVARTMEFADTTASFTFYAQAKDSLTGYVRVVTPNYATAKIPYPIDSGNGTEYPSQYILMETFPEQPYDTTQDIPLAAFTTGLVQPMDFEGRKSLWIDFCGLRDAHADPKTWQEQYHVPRFVYFSLRME